MADISVSCSSSRAGVTYFPAIPPTTPKAAISYNQAVTHAPFTALAGVVVDGRQPYVHPVTPRCRMRKQVGYTNRWRLPESLGSDLLGSSQAGKSVTFPYNSSTVNIISAENPRTQVNRSVEGPYQFRMGQDRPQTTPLQASIASTSSEKSRLSASIPPKINRLAPLKTFIPSSARPAKPMDIFLYHSKKSRSMKGPDSVSDVLLKCCDMNWELHRPFLQKSQTLSDLLEAADAEPSPKQYYKSKTSETVDEQVKKTKIYDNEQKADDSAVPKAEDVDATPSKQGVSHPKHTSQRKVNSMTVIELDVQDPLITQTTLAVALGNLYHDNVDVDVCDLVGVLAAAHVLKFTDLEQGCVDLMLKSISYRTVCGYHEVARKYNQDHLESACERWLDVNMVAQLSMSIQLRELPMELLSKTLKSNRLFTYSEYALYKTVVYWVFLQMNPNVQLVPSYESVLSYFNSLPKASGLIEREEGQEYTPLFMALRMHGILDITHIQDVQTMNVVPQSWVVKLLSHHYQSLQGGGDMMGDKNFNVGAVRQGFIIDEEPHYHSEIMSIHGFHFELKAIRQNKGGAYSFYMQRLKPRDPVLSFRQCERHTFSMRPDRDVRYNIKIQYFDGSGQCQTYTTEVINQLFGLGNKTSKSKVVTLDNLTPPIYAQFAVQFPPS